ncbi:MAG: hypothetical protein IT305_07100 [Chloroflexi bacterium]|nr:hypothetical protein [Chloroflexota bacterium]
MTGARVTFTPKRVLLVSNDDGYILAFRRALPTVQVLTLDETLTVTALRAGFNVARGIDALVLDGSVRGAVRLRLYGLVRPEDESGIVPVVFTRTAFRAEATGLVSLLDFYHSDDTGPFDTAKFVRRVLDWRTLTAQRGALAGGLAVTNGPSCPAARESGEPVTLGVLRRIGVWGVAAAMAGLTLWPTAGPLTSASMVAPALAV